MITLVTNNTAISSHVNFTCIDSGLNDVTCVDVSHTDNITIRDDNTRKTNTAIIRISHACIDVARDDNADAIIGIGVARNDSTSYETDAIISIDVARNDKMSYTLTRNSSVANGVKSC